MSTNNNSYTSNSIEDGLKKMEGEINPFCNGHLSKLGIKRNHLETIGEMMERWGETIACSELANDSFEFLQSEYFDKIKREDKQVLINKHINQYTSKYRLSEKSTRFEEGYTNKGFRWFEEKKDFSLRDFILYHPETISDQVYDEAVKFISYPLITEALIENAPKQELYFCYACEGYAFAKYVSFLKEEETEEEENLPKKKIMQDAFISRKFIELFAGTILIDSCLDLLRETDKPCINDENGFIRNKGVFVIWFNALEAKRMFNYSFKNDEERAATLNKNFTGLNISASIFRYENKRAKEYKNHFESEISALKH